MTCFTCANSYSNEECNLKAIDEPCALNTSFTNNTNESQGDKEKNPNFACLTIHRFDISSSRTISVDKKCTTECSKEIVGCKFYNISNGDKFETKTIKVKFITR